MRIIGVGVPLSIGVRGMGWIWNYLQVKKELLSNHSDMAEGGGISGINIGTREIKGYTGLIKEKAIIFGVLTATHTPY